MVHSAQHTVGLRRRRNSSQNLPHGQYSTVVRETVHRNDPPGPVARIQPARKLLGRPQVVHAEASASVGGSRAARTEG
ncbi:hypothetical protein GCM10022285_01240 [Streptomyces tunisiensis]|uniref:Uncharacterized protein n=1 Tax=Streptomyces tunisiensis TaxID=948699 RepID=A0ABP7XLI4_9ACTN